MRTYFARRAFPLTPSPLSPPSPPSNDVNKLGWWFMARNSYFFFIRNSVFIRVFWSVNQVFGWRIFSPLLLISIPCVFSSFAGCWHELEDIQHWDTKIWFTAINLGDWNIYLHIRINIFVSSFVFLWICGHFSNTNFFFLFYIINPNSHLEKFTTN